MSNSTAPPSPSERAQAEALYLENRRTVGDVVKKYYRQYLFDDDVMQEAHLAFWRACCAYDPSRGSLYALAVRYILNEIRRLHMMANLQHRTPPAPLIPLDAQAMDGEGSPLHEMYGVQPDTGWLDSKAFLASLSDRERQAVQFAYCGYSQKEIAARIGVSRQWVNQCMQKARTKFDKCI